MAESLWPSDMLSDATKVKQKLLYLTNIRLPTERAHGLQIVKSCNAFAKLGFEVKLVVPTRRQSAIAAQMTDIWKAYAIERNFTVQYVPSFDPFSLPLGKYAFLLQSALFAFEGLIEVLLFKPDVIYTRDYYFLPVFRLFGIKNIYYEGHESQPDWPKTRIKWVFSKAKLIMTSTNALKQYFVDSGVDAKRIMPIPNGVDDRFFSPKKSFNISKKYDIPENKVLVMYTGALYFWKGVKDLVDCAQWLPENYSISIFGGVESDQMELKQYVAEKKLEHKVLILGFVEHSQVPSILSCADVLVIPNTDYWYSKNYTSPIKLIEYLAVGKPLVVSDLPSMREIVSEEHVYFTKPRKPKLLAKTIVESQKDKKLSIQKTKKGQLLAREHT